MPYLGFKHSEESKKKMSDSRKGNKHPFFGKHHSEETKRKIGKASKGRIVTEETRKKISLVSSKQIGPNRGKKFSEEWKRKIGEAHRGIKTWTKIKHHSVEVRKKIGEAITGEKNPNWKGGITPHYLKIRNSERYKLWRKAVFERDNYACILCGDNKGGNLQADHIKPFAYFPKLRFDINNGRTLCISCHKKTDTYTFKALNYNTPDTI